MAQTLSAMIEQVRELAPHLKIALRSDFASRVEGHRARIRATLHQLTGDESVLNLETPPQLKDKFVCISHCRSIGGFVLSNGPIGFDIEETRRVSPAVAERMSHQNDDKQSPSPAALWTAREAVYKSLGARQPAIMNDFAITNWVALNHDTFRFHSSNGVGFAILSAPWTMAIFEPVSG